MRQSWLHQARPPLHGRRVAHLLLAVLCPQSQSRHSTLVLVVRLEPWFFVLAHCQAAEGLIMPFCPSCGTPVAVGDAQCGSCREALPAQIALTAAATQPATGRTPVPQEWISFTSWDGSFSLQYPADWQPVSPPVSEGASLSCAGPDRFTLLEAFGLQNDRLRGR